MVPEKTSDYSWLLAQISHVYANGQAVAIKAIHHAMLVTYWRIGQHIVEFEQAGQQKSVYGSKLIERLSKDLSNQFGKGFSRSNLIYMRLLYQKYPQESTLSHQLTWGHYVDLVFYHRILRCFVLIDLKVDDVAHHDIGQMNMYLGYFAEEENTEGDNPPIGLIMTRERDELLVKYATYGISSQLFVSKYQFHLPNEQQLRQQLEHLLSKEPDSSEEEGKP